jgi:hypothetical protein
MCCLGCHCMPALQPNWLEPQSADLPATCRWKWAAAVTDRIDRAFTGDRDNIPESDTWARHWPQTLTVQTESGLNRRQPTMMDELLTQIRGVCRLLAGEPAGGGSPCMAIGLAGAAY